ncbi:hypothetical protein AB0E01_37925 [Nocardia vinacea]|uniref:hypothetical protein n=1 Tax=Nocardia vinacea TaxID=96468 RepID=UPI003402C894
MSRLWLVWVVTRMLMVVLTGVTVLPHSVWDASAADLTLYRGWAEQILHQNIFPLADERWQYPPGAGALLVVPRLLGGGVGYNWLFFALVAAADASVLGLLIRAARRGGWEIVMAPTRYPGQRCPQWLQGAWRPRSWAARCC